jgi:hypothetical protein
MSEGNGSTAPVERNASGQFLPGHRSRGGRGRGSRSKLSEKFLADLHAQWLKNGKTVLAEVAQKHPDVFLRIIASVMPKVLDIEGNITVSNRLAIEIKDFQQAWEQWGKFVGAASLVEIEAPDDEADDD